MGRLSIRRTGAIVGALLVAPALVAVGALVGWLGGQTPLALPLLVASIGLIVLVLVLRRRPAIELGDGEIVWRPALARRARRLPLASIGEWRIQGSRLTLDTTDGAPVVIDLSQISDGDRERLRRELEA